ncbi:MAG TPA: hypothetical protein P5121_08120 [Caldilineaceae bacterium]|nr:hypothetical protein [Caldilineaceae bacterium]
MRNMVALQWASLLLTFRRLIAQRWLALAALLGLTTSIALLVSIPLYVDAVYFRLLQDELQGAQSQAAAFDRTPFVFLFRYQGFGTGTTQRTQLETADRYIATQAERDLGLPRALFARHLRTAPFRLFPADSADFANDSALGWFGIGSLSNLGQELTLEAGTFPITSPEMGDALPVLVSTTTARERDIQVGDRYVFFYRDLGGGRQLRLPVQVTGIAQLEPFQKRFWFYEFQTLDTVLLVDEAAFAARVLPLLEAEQGIVGMDLALWYLELNGDSVRAGAVNPLVTRINRVQRTVAAFLPQLHLATSPVEALNRYRRGYNELLLLLVVFSLPIVGLTLAFALLVLRLLLENQQLELAILRSRGATVAQTVGMILLQAACLGGLALLVALPLACELARWIGSTRAFLDFDPAPALSVRLTSGAFSLGIGAVGALLLIQWPVALATARVTIVDYKQRISRRRRPPWWQRNGIDLLLLLPAGYAVYILQRQGQLVLPSTTGATLNDPLQNPLLLLTPALLALALTLFTLRVFPLVTRLATHLLTPAPTVSLLLAARQLARSPSNYHPPLILLMLTLSLAGFTASLARTLDRNQLDQHYYQAGADLRLSDFEDPARSRRSEAAGGTTAASTDANSTAEDGTAAWRFFPHRNYTQVEGVTAATRVARYPSLLHTGSGQQPVTLLALDRIEFPQVAFWRQDFAQETLGGLMNLLALKDDGVLVPRAFLQASGLTVSDALAVKVDVGGRRLDLSLIIVGAFDLFPTWYPDEPPLLVGNLGYLFQQTGGEVPYELWLALAPARYPSQFKALVADLQRLNQWVIVQARPGVELVAAAAAPARQGLYGLLSVGFLGALLLTVLGVGLYAFFSLRRRRIELGVLRAVGLSGARMARLIGWELLAVSAVGIGVGVALGALVSYLFIPTLQIGATAADRTPPFQVEMAWPLIGNITLGIVAALLITLGMLVLLLSRIKIFETIKLGETV